MRRTTAQFAAALVLCSGLTPIAVAQAAHSFQASLPSTPDVKVVNQNGMQRAAAGKSVATPGVSATQIVIGNISPAQDADDDTGTTVQAVLSGYFDDVNQRGGIYGRQISLRFADSGGSDLATAKSARRLAAAPVFAMVAPFAPGTEKSLAALAHTSKLPVVGLMALSVPAEPLNREVFYLLPGFEQLEQELVRFAAVEGTRTTDKTAVVVADAKLETSVSPAMQVVWKELGEGKAREFSFSPANGPQVIHELQSQGIDTVFFVGDGEQASQWVQAADKAGWSPKTFVLGALMDESILSAPARFQGRIFAAYPELEPEMGAVDEFEDFLQRHQLSHDHRLIQISAYCSAKIFVDALARAGKNPTREKLILNLEQMRDFKTGLLPSITFGPNRRIGSFKAEIVCADLVSHSFQPECGKTPSKSPAPE